MFLFKSCFSLKYYVILNYITNYNGLISSDIHYIIFDNVIKKNLVRKMDERVFVKCQYFILYFLIHKSFNFAQTSLVHSYSNVTPIRKLPYTFQMIYFNSYYFCGLFHFLWSNLYVLYTYASTISLTIYTRLVLKLYHINFVSYLLYPLRFHIIVNRQFCLQLFQCYILIINTGY